MKRLAATVIAMSAGLIVMLGYFIPLPVFQDVRQELLHWAITLSAVALLVGVLNLFSVHVEKISRREKGSLYSLVLVTALFAAAVFSSILGPDNPGIRLWLVDSVIIPVEASLMAILSVTLIYASIRLLRRRTDIMTIIFVITALLILAGLAPMPLGEIQLFNYIIKPLITLVPVTAGARGLLIGVALGTLLTGLRILLGIDRPYGGK